jgi:hypothetical protein
LRRDGEYECEGERDCDRRVGGESGPVEPTDLDLDLDLDRDLDRVLDRDRDDLYIRLLPSDEVSDDADADVVGLLARDEAEDAAAAFDFMP